MPIPQFNATVVNCHLGRFHAKGQRLRRQFKDKALGAWMGHLSGMREENAWRYLAMLKERVSS